MPRPRRQPLRAARSRRTVERVRRDDEDDRSGEGGRPGGDPSWIDDVVVPDDISALDAEVRALQPGAPGRGPAGSGCAGWPARAAWPARW